MKLQKNKSLSIALVMLLLIGMTMTFGIRSVTAQTTYVSVINPATGDGNFLYTNTSPPPGGVFTANITITDVEMLAGWQVNLTWDPALLSIADAADLFLPADHIFKDLDPKSVGKDINDTAGRLLWGCAVGPAAPQTHFNGSGRLMCVKFTVAKTPSEGETLSCNLVLDRVGIYSTSLVDPDANDITFTEQNGYYEYKYPVLPPAQYTLSIDTSPTGVNFTVDGAPHTSPWSETYLQGTSVSVEMPETHTVGNVTYNWIQWSDGNTSRLRTFTMNANITVIGYYTGLVGDLNGDGRVDVKDLVLFIKAFGSKPGHGRWNPLADFNKDGKINIVDLLILMRNFGKHLP